MKDPDNKSFWQRFAGMYRRVMRSDSSLYSSVAQRIGQKLRPSMTVLELACGTGQISLPLADHVSRWEATDFSPAMIAEAKKQPAPPQLHFSVQDATSLPYADDSFDAVVIANALHVMPHPEQALREIRRVLRSDGILFVPNFISSSGLLFRIRFFVMDCFGFHVFHDWNQKELAEFLEQNGFQVRTCEMLGESIAPLCYLEAVIPQ